MLVRLLVLGLLTIVVLVAAPGCASIDPTEQSFAISFENNLGEMATLKTCGDQTCTSFPNIWKLAPGASVQDNISDRGVVTRWIVLAKTIHTRRCLPLLFHAKYKDVVVQLSQAEPCPGKPLPISKLRLGPKLGGET
jgi:hypothetical protein